MSSWTHVNGIITVSIPGVYSNPVKVKGYVEYALAKLKKNGHEITGSEGPCDMWVNSYKSSSWCSDLGNGYSSAIITLCGGLRDREGNRTDREIKDFIENLRRFCMIVFCHIDMFCDWEKNAYVYATVCHETVKRDLQQDCMNTYLVRDSCDFTEEYVDRLWGIARKNFERYNNDITDRELADIYDRVAHLDPGNFKRLMESGWLCRQVDFCFTDDLWEWRKEHGLKPFDEIRLGGE